MNFPDETSPPADPGNLLRVRREAREYGIVLRIAGEVDMATAGSLSAQLRTATEIAVSPALVIADLDQVEYLGSAGLLVLVQAHERCERHGVPLRIVSSSRPVLRSIAVTGLGDLLSVSRTLEAALAAA